MKRQFVSDKTTAKDKKNNKKGVNGPTNSEIKSAAKAASDRFARLGIVTEILRGAGRERYDHFLNNGFPTWKGTGYYYARFRPGLGSVLFGLFLFVGGGGHWLALYLSWQREQKWIERLISEGRKGWRDNIPGLDAAISGSGTATPVPAAEESEPQQAIPRNRRERRMADKMEAKDMKKEVKKPKAAKASPVPTPPAGATGTRRRVRAANSMPLLVDAVGNVYVEQADEDGEIQEILLDVRILLFPLTSLSLYPFTPSSPVPFHHNSSPFNSTTNQLTPPSQPTAFPKPTLKSTAVYRLPIWVFSTALSRFTSPLSQETTDATDNDSNTVNKDSSDEAEEEGAVEDLDTAVDGFQVIKSEKAKTSAVNGTGKVGKRGKKGKR